MNRWLVIGGIALGVLLVLILAAAIVAQVKYRALFASPEVSHESIASEFTSFRARIQPALALDEITESVTRPRGVPGWAVPLALPYEASLLLDPDLVDAQLNYTLFINDRRFGPLLAQMVNDSGMLTALTAQGGIVEEETKKGSLLWKGQAPLPQASVDLVHEHWGIISPLSALRLEGGHFVEAVLDLRDGRGFAIVGWLTRDVPEKSPLHASQLVHFLKKMSDIRLDMDIQSQDLATVTLRIECRPESRDSDVNSLRFLLNTVYQQAEPSLESTYGIEIESDTAIEDLTLTGTYEVRHWKRLLPLLGLG